MRVRVPARRAGFKSQLCLEGGPPSLSFPGWEAGGWIWRRLWFRGLFHFCRSAPALSTWRSPKPPRQGLQASAPSWVRPQDLSTSEGGRGPPGLKAHTLPQALGFQLERRCTPSPRRPMGWLIPPVPSHPAHISVNSPLLKSPRINHLVCAICFPLGPCPNPAGLVSPPVWSPCYLKLPSGECRGWAQIPGDGLWVLDQGMVQLQGTWTWRVRIRNPDGDGPLCGAFASCRSQQQPHFRGRQQAALSTD